MHEENSSNNTNATIQDLLTEYDVGITRPIEERSKPMPDSHLYIDSTADVDAGDVVVPQTTTPDLFVQEEVKVNAPTLQTSATLAKFQNHVPDFVRKDKKGAARNDAVAGAKKGTHRGSKVILDCPAHKALKKCADDFYQYHMKTCAKWAHGQQMLPMCRYREYRAEEVRVMGRTENGVFYPGVFYTELKPAFLAAYPAAVAQAQIDMGSSFDPSLYPSVAKLERTVRIKVVYEPIAGSDDFRLDIPAQAMEEIKSTYEKAMQENMQSMAESMWTRLLDPLQNMSEKLDYDDATGKPRNGHFHGTLVTNVLEIVDLMRDCNFNNDPDMARVVRQLRNALTGVSTDMLKVSEVQRLKTKEEVDNIIKSLPTFGI